MTTAVRVHKSGSRENMANSLAGIHEVKDHDAKAAFAFFKEKWLAANGEPDEELSEALVERVGPESEEYLDLVEVFVNEWRSKRRA